MLANGADPASVKFDLEAEAKVAAANTFKAIADEYIEKSAKKGRAAVTIKKTRWLLSLMEGDLGKRPISEITPADLLETLQKVEAKGHLETARRMRSLAGRIFRYAVATSRATADPSALLRGALIAPKVQDHSAILEATKAISAGQRYEFSSLYPDKRPMSENTINAALRRLGCSGKEMTAHSFRAMISTLLNESGKWSFDAIERALAHKDSNAIRGTYHRGTLDLTSGNGSMVERLLGYATHWS